MGTTTMCDMCDDPTPYNPYCMEYGDNWHYEDCSCDECHDLHKNPASWAAVCRRCEEQAAYEMYMNKYFYASRELPLQPEEFERLRRLGKLEI